MRKIVMPAKCKVHSGVYHRAFAEIEFVDGKLSIHGVVGPRYNGSCEGSCGQCVDEIRSGEPADGWDRKMLDKFCAIWDEWHLNDMHPECEHQRNLGWNNESSEKITLYHYRLNCEANKLREAAKKSAIEALKNGETFTPTPEQTFYASLEYFYDIYDPISEEMEKYYEPKKPLYNGDIGATEEKVRRFVRYDENPKGILCKPCPVCGYRYGSAWKKVDVPQDVIDWLFDLPDAPVVPAWV